MGYNSRVMLISSFAPVSKLQQAQEWDVALSGACETHHYFFGTFHMFWQTDVYRAACFDPSKT